MIPKQKETWKWTQDEDDILSSIVILHIQKGSSQTRAFAEAAKVLGRTLSACSFRWHSVLRKQNESKKQHEHICVVESPKMIEEPNDAFKFVSLLQAHLTEYEKVIEENRILKQKLKEAEGRSTDFTALVSMLSRARELYRA